MDRLSSAGRVPIGRAERLQIGADTRLIDIGCGAGGPARAVAARYGCRVTGIDLTDDFIKTGGRLSEACGLQGSVFLHHGSALDMPFDDSAFDRAMMLHVGMNIADKAALMQTARVLEPGGLFCVYDMMRVRQGTLTFPLPWASDASVRSAAGPRGADLMSWETRQYIDAAAQAGLVLAPYDEFHVGGLAAMSAFHVDPALGRHVMKPLPRPVLSNIFWQQSPSR